MANLKAKINYLYNSSFKVETENNILIFDYYNDVAESKFKNACGGVIGEDDLNTNKRISVFSTHSHGDHFSEVIFKWGENRPDIQYILSSDIKTENMDVHIHFISAYEEMTLNDMHIKAFGSTDLGVSFLVKVDGVDLFHAGDLNWWNWYDESDEYNAEMEKTFKTEIEKVKGENIDIAFFPVDPRLKESYNLGPNYFIEEIWPKTLIPMHFREDYYITREFKDSCRNHDIQIFEINKRGEQLIYI